MSGSILVLSHAADTQALVAFLQLLTASQAQHTFPWEINNKYYTARVHFHHHVLDPPKQQEEPPADAPVIIYAFTAKHANPPQRLLDLLTTSSPELSFALRLPSAEEPYDPQVEEDSFDEHGLEYVDLTALHTAPDRANDDGQTPCERMEQFTQSLQTIPWPNMIRKTLHTTPRSGLASSASACPVQTPPTPPRFDDPEADDAAFFEGEFARLDAWLDAEPSSIHPPPPPHAGTIRNPATGNIKSEFDDDFVGSSGGEEFSPFQSGRNGSRPTGFSSAEEEDRFLPTDPTQLFNHLQSVRASLAGLDDEDLRRRRAAEEVAAVFRGLGIEVGDLEADSDGDSEGD